MLHHSLQPDGSCPDTDARLTSLVTFCTAESIRVCIEHGAAVFGPPLAALVEA